MLTVNRQGIRGRVPTQEEIAFPRIIQAGANFRRSSKESSRRNAFAGNA
jgi:hypothetical protein